MNEYNAITKIPYAFIYAPVSMHIWSRDWRNQMYIDMCTCIGK